MCSKGLRDSLEKASWSVALHKDTFEGERADHEWIPIVTEQGHAVITSDKKMATWRAEDGKVRPAIERCGAKVFFLRGVGLTPEEQAKAVNEARRSLCRHVKRCAGTFLIARIHSIGSRLGEIQVLQEGGGTKAEKKYGKDTLIGLDDAARD